MIFRVVIFCVSFCIFTLLKVVFIFGLTIASEVYTTCAMRKAQIFFKIASEIDMSVCRSCEACYQCGSLKRLSMENRPSHQVTFFSCLIIASEVCIIFAMRNA